MDVEGVSQRSHGHSEVIKCNCAGLFFVCLQDYVKTTERISMKLSVRRDTG